MSSGNEFIWKELKTYIETTYAKSDPGQAETLKIYINLCEPVSFDDGRLILSVPTTFALEKINTTFLPKFRELFAQTGLGTDLAVIIGKEAQKPKESVRPQAAEPARQPNNTNISRNGLNKNYIFSSFVVGPSNRMAHSACLSVAEKPGVAYNPLFIWGKVGLGKTHLMHAIGHHIENSYPGIKVLYVSAEKFMNDFISSIKNSNNSNSTNEFRTRYRDLDVLMIDDIQFFHNKEGTQEEFFHTFNILHNANKQIIISSDRPPKDIPDVEQRLISRFSWGLITDIQLPDFETRVAILQKKIELKKYNIPQDIILFIAQNVPSNIRELEGTLNRIMASSEFNNEPINLENVSVWLKDIIRSNQAGPVNISTIQQMVAESLGYSIEDLLSHRRTAELALARQIAMYIAREKTSESLQSISHAFNKKDHTTVIHACNKVESVMKKDLRTRSFVDNIVAKL